MIVSQPVATVLPSIRRSILLDERACARIRVKERVAGSRSLRVIGCILIAFGFVNGPGSILLTWLREIAVDCWWISTAIILAIVFKNSLLRSRGRAASVVMLLIWFLFRIEECLAVLEDSASRMGEQFLGLTLAILGAMIVFTNDPDGHTFRFFRSIALIIRNRSKAFVLLCVSTLCLANPVHSHSLCLKASTFCEQRGENEAAISFAALARDTFPPRSFCQNCSEAIREHLSLRIASIKAKQAVTDWPSDVATWFMADTAKEAIIMVGNVVALLREHDKNVRILQSSNARVVYYEGEMQIVISEFGAR